MDNITRILVSNLRPCITEDDLQREKFPNATSIRLARDPSTLKSRCFANVEFGNPAHHMLALRLSGTKLFEKPMIISVVEGNVTTPLYLNVSGMAFHTKLKDVRDRFAMLCRDPPLVYLPSREKGVAFVYLTNMDDYRMCLTLDQTSMGCKTITVTPGLFNGGQPRGVGDA